MICVINFHYQVFINLFYFVLMIVRSVYITTVLVCVCWGAVSWYFLPPTENSDHGKFDVQSRGL